MPAQLYKPWRFEYYIDDQLERLGAGSNPARTDTSGNWIRKRVSFKSFTYPTSNGLYRVICEFVTNRTFANQQEFLEAFTRFITEPQLINGLPALRRQLRDGQSIIRPENVGRFTLMDYILMRRHVLATINKPAINQRLDLIVSFLVQNPDLANLYWVSTSLRNTQRIRVNTPQVEAVAAVRAPSGLPDIFNMEDVF